MTLTVTNKERQEVLTNLESGVRYENMYFSFTKRQDGVMLRYDLNKGTYKFYTNLNSFLNGIVRMTKRGW